MPRKKTWREKLLDNPDLPKVGPITEKMSRRWGAGTMVVPAPIEVDSIMRQVPKGKLITIDDIRTLLAGKHKVDITCPLTTGIFAWIAAHAAQEKADAGKKRITPFWRTLKSKGEINLKYPGGLDFIRDKLQSEGHRIRQNGKRFFVQDFQKKVVRSDRVDVDRRYDW